MPTLQCHAGTGDLPVHRLDATAELSGAAPGDAPRLTARFVLEAQLAAFVLPPRGVPRRADGLWRHSCFELFVRLRGAAAYAEVNVAPSAEWAAYRFTARRTGMPPIDAAWQAAIASTVSASSLALDFSLPLAALLDAPPPQAVLEFGFAAVLESRHGRLSYWALAHPDPARPDFHHPGSFVHAIRYRAADR